MELTKHINLTLHIINTNPKRHLNHSDILPLGPNDILCLLTSGRSHAIGMLVSRHLWKLSQTCKPTSRNFSRQNCASVCGIQGTFLAQNSGHSPELVITFRIHQRHDDKTTKPKTNLNTRLDHPQLGLTFRQTLGINATYRSRIQEKAWMTENTYETWQ